MYGVNHKVRPLLRHFIIIVRVFEFYEAVREFLLKPPSAERRKLGPLLDLIGGPATAQAPPRLRIMTANVDARGWPTLARPFHGSSSLGFFGAFMVEPANQKDHPPDISALRAKREMLSVRRPGEREQPSPARLTNTE